MPYGDYALPWDEYARRVRASEGNPNSPNFLRPQWDVRQWTSGYGTRAAGPDERIDRTEAERRFDTEFGGARDRVRAFAPGLSTGREAALASLTMNAGPGWMNQGLGRAVQAGDWADARQRFLQYTSPDPRYHQGLFNRRLAEAQWLADAPRAPMGVPAAADTGPLLSPALMASARAPLPGRIGELGGRSLIAPPAGGIGPVMPQDLFSRPPPPLPAYPRQAPISPPAENIDPVPPPPPITPDNPVYPPPPPAILPMFPGVGPPGPFGGDTPIGSPDMSPGPGGAMPPPPPAPPEDEGAGPGLGMPGATVTPFVDPRPPISLIDRGINPGFMPPDVVPDRKFDTGGVTLTQPPASDTGAVPSFGTTPRSVPTTTTAPAQAGGMAPSVADQSLAATLFGPKVAGVLRGLGNNELIRTGLGFAAAGPSGATALSSGLAQAQHNEIARARLGIEQAQEGRAAETYGRGTADYNRKLAAYNQAFADPENSRLLKPFTPEAREAVKAMGPEAAMDFLGKYQLADAEARAKMQRQMEQIDTFKKMAAGQSAAAAPTPPQLPATPPMPPDIGGLGRPSIASQVPPEAGVGLSRAMAPRAYSAPAGGGGAGPPAAAGPVAAAAAMPTLPPVAGRGVLPQTPGVVPPTGPEPIVNILGMPMPLSQAQAMVDYMKATGMDVAPEQARINAAMEPQKEYAKKIALEQAAQDQAKPQARQATSAALDALDRTKSLAIKLRDNPNLRFATGYYSDPDLDPNAGIVARTIRGLTSPSAGSPARTAQVELQNLAQKIGLQTLQSLKTAASNGASGLGSTSAPELAMLENSLAALSNPSIEYEAVKQNLNNVLVASARIEQRMRAGWEETYNEPYSEPGGQKPFGRYPTEPPPAPPVVRGRSGRAARGLSTGNAAFLAPPKVGDIRNGRPFLGGDPKDPEAWGPRE